MAKLVKSHMKSHSTEPNYPLDIKVNKYWSNTGHTGHKFVRKYFYRETHFNL